MTLRQPLLRCTARLSSPSTFLRASGTSLTPNRNQSPSTNHNRYLHHRKTSPTVPEPIPFCPDVPTFLKLIGRNLSSHADKFPTWQSLFTLTSPELKTLGIEPARTRKYLLRWVEKFRHREYGVGGDLKTVGDDGAAELRLVEVPWEMVEGKANVMRRAHIPHLASAISDAESKTAEAMKRVDPAASGVIEATVSRTPRTKPMILNVPPGTNEKAKTSEKPLAEVESNPLDEKTLKAATRVDGYKIQGAHVIAGPHVELIKGTDGRGALLKPMEGMWEHRRGVKTEGGERRKAHVRAKKRAKERAGQRS